MSGPRYRRTLDFSTAPVDFINSLPSTMNCRASYPGVAWASTPSAGVNAGSLIAFGTAPAVGAAINGFTPGVVSAAVPSAFKTTGISGTFIHNNAMSIVCYLKASSAPPPGAFFAEGQIACPDKGWGLTLSTNGVTARGPTTQTAALPFSLNVLHQVAMTYDGVNIRCYVDAVKSTMADPGVLDVADDPIGFGCRNAFGSLNGTFLEAQIFDSVLTDLQITNMLAAYVDKYT